MQNLHLHENHLFKLKGMKKWLDERFGIKIDPKHEWEEIRILGDGSQKRECDKIDYYSWCQLQCIC